MFSFFIYIILQNYFSYFSVFSFSSLRLFKTDVLIFFFSESESYDSLDSFLWDLFFFPFEWVTFPCVFVCSQSLIENLTFEKKSSHIFADWPHEMEYH